MVDSSLSAIALLQVHQQHYYHVHIDQIQLTAYLRYAIVPVRSGLVPLILLGFSHPAGICARLILLPEDLQRVVVFV